MEIDKNNKQYVYVLRMGYEHQILGVFLSIHDVEQDVEASLIRDGTSDTWSIKGWDSHYVERVVVGEYISQI